MSVIDTDPGFKRLMATLNDMKLDTVAVGLFEESENEPDSEYATVQVGAVHEFGCETAGKNHNIVIPQRSFLRGTLDQMADKLNEIRSASLSEVFAHARTNKEVLSQMGGALADACKKRIADGIEPANAASTIARKGSSKPLVNTGHLRSSIKFKVRAASENLSEGSVAV